MTTIIAGGFENIVPADAAIEHLKQAGVSADNICKFRINPPGMHDAYPIGGDRDESPGSKDADKGAMKGMAAGAAAGAVAGALLGPIGAAAGAGVGAYTGSLVGAMKETESEVKPEHEDVRPAEVMVAVNANAAGIAADEIVRVLEEAGAWQVERAEGTWTDGEWADFNPVSRPQLIGGSDKQTKGTAQSARR
jgi:outer membrane protein with glycine zipper